MRQIRTGMQLSTDYVLANLLRVFLHRILIPMTCRRTCGRRRLIPGIRPAADRGIHRHDSGAHAGRAIYLALVPMCRVPDHVPCRAIPFIGEDLDAIRQFITPGLGITLVREHLLHRGRRGYGHLQSSGVAAIMRLSTVHEETRIRDGAESALTC